MPLYEKSISRRRIMGMCEINLSWIVDGEINLLASWLYHRLVPLVCIVYTFC